MSEQRPCKHCGTLLRFVPMLSNPEKALPLDVEARVYAIVENEAGEAHCVRVHDSAVHHVHTCPQFNKEK